MSAPASPRLYRTALALIGIGALLTGLPQRAAAQAAKAKQAATPGKKEEAKPPAKPAQAKPDATPSKAEASNKPGMTEKDDAEVSRSVEKRFRNLSDEERAKLKAAGEAERQAILKRAGWRPQEIASPSLERLLNPGVTPQPPAPDGSAILLRRRRDEVKRLEAEYAAKGRMIDPQPVDRARLISQQEQAVERARKAYDEAADEAAVAGVALVEYTQGTLPEQLGKLEADIAAAVQDAEKAQQEAREAEKDGGVSESRSPQAAQLNSMRASAQADNARNRLQVLKKFESERNIQQLKFGLKKCELIAATRWADVCREVRRLEELKKSPPEARPGMLDLEAQSARRLQTSVAGQRKVVESLSRVADGEKLPSGDILKLLQEARDLEVAAGQDLAAAMKSAEIVANWRAELRELGERLRKAREDLERQQGAVPANAQGQPARAPASTRPDDPRQAEATALIRRRREEVGRLEAEYNAQRRLIAWQISRIVQTAAPTGRDGVAPTIKDEATPEKQARLAVDQASKDVEVAQIRIREYQEGTLRQAVQSAEGEKILAEVEVKTAGTEFDLAGKRDQQGLSTASATTNALLKQEKAKTKANAARARIQELNDYTSPRVIAEQNRDLQRAVAEKRFQEAVLKIEQDRQAALNKQSDEFGPPVAEARVALIIDSAILKRTKAADLLSRLDGRDHISAESAKVLADDTQKKKEEAKKLEGEAQREVERALELAKLVAAWREEFRDLGDRLRQARADLERLEPKAR
ncbi:MAG: hypothetical protein U0800_14135 [Isosphaeraceae bacterium]